MMNHTIAVAKSQSIGIQAKSTQTDLHPSAKPPAPAPAEPTPSQRRATDWPTGRQNTDFRIAAINLPARLDGGTSKSVQQQKKFAVDLQAIQHGSRPSIIDPSLADRWGHFARVSTSHFLPAISQPFHSHRNETWLRKEKRRE